jgi:hypothetical protein
MECCKVFESNSSHKIIKTTLLSKMDPPKATPVNSASPTRKKKIDYSGGPPKLDKASGLVSKRTTAPGIVVVQALRPDGIRDAYLGNILEHIKQDNKRKEKCKIGFFTYLRDPKGDNMTLETADKSGNKYPTDVIVLILEDDTSIAAAVSHLANEMSSIAKTECSDDWKFGTSFFINKGDATPSVPMPLSHYVMDYACASVIRRSYKNCKTKEALLSNVARAAIFEEIFGSDKVGVAAIESVDAGFYVNL